MTVATLERVVEGSSHSGSGAAATLEESIRDAWEGLLVEGRCACPVCGGTMHERGGNGSCDGCGSELA